MKVLIFYGRNVIIRNIEIDINSRILSKDHFLFEREFKHMDSIRTCIHIYLSTRSSNYINVHRI